MRNTIFIFLMIATVFNLCAQQNYPLEVLPGKTIKVSSGEDTLWVINNQQIQDYIRDGLILKKADSTFNIFQAEIRTLQRVIASKNEIMRQMSENYNNLKQNLKECEANLEEEPNGGRKKKKK